MVQDNICHLSKDFDNTSSGAQAEIQQETGSKHTEVVQQKQNTSATVSSKVNIIQPVLINPVVTPSNLAHNGRVCSTWGNFHFKTFDGYIFSFPGLCNYVFASHCNTPYEDFNIQIRRIMVENAPTINRITMKLEGVAVELLKAVVMINSNRVQLPYSESGIMIEKSSIYVKVASKMGIVLMWNEDDSILLELNEKYANQTCGLCGDFNGLPIYNEFYSNNLKMTALQFGNMQKMDGPTEHCEDSTSTLPDNCTDNFDDICQKTLTSSAFAECNDLLDVGEYIMLCQDDLCHSEESKNASCICDTFAEYSRQCAHAGGHPLNWRTSKLCPKKCPYNMQYQECGSPCADTCTNPDRSQFCEEHCTDGCFCPPGSVFDDINNSGCIPHQQCSCVYNGNTYATGTSFSQQCHSCTCNGGQWNCQDLSCPGTCSVEGGSHISTYDKKHYDHHGDCTYVLSKHCKDETFTILVELRKCGLTDTETCLKTVTLNMNKGQTLIEVKPDGHVFVNSIYTQLPISAANVTVFRPSSFFIIMQTNFGVHLEIQITPIMQVFVRLDPIFKDQTCGLCGNFNNIQTDDFKAINGIIEGTATAFAHTWKTQAACPNIQHSFENPCALSIDNEKYAQHWCGLLTDSKGPFADCHYAVNPSVYHTNCMYDTCNCEMSEDCLCAALSSYVRACAAKGIQLHGWRTDVCSKYTMSCPKSLSYSYTISSCQPTCRSLSEPDVTCNIKFVPVDGCTCVNGTYMDESGKCVPANECPCYYRGSPISVGEVVHENGLVCTCMQGRLNCIGAPNPIPVCEPPMIYFDCRNITAGKSGAECQKSCHTLDMQCYNTQCISGCVCPDGLVLDGNSGCIPEEECSCIHNEAMYQPGEKINVDCNTCVCKNRKWECTKDQCLGTCAVYGDGHYNTFDDKRFSFNGNCEYTLVQDHCGKSGTANGTFRVITENIPCGNTGTTCSKSIKVFLESYELILGEEHVSVIKRGQNDKVPYTVRYMGMYFVIETTSGLILMWDKKTSIFIKLSPAFKGQICGLCGNYDGNSINDFTTRSQSVVENVLEFGNSWKVSSTCPDAYSIKDPCSTNPYRKSWSEKQCSIINSNIFAACHSQVEPAKYYQACVTDACACDTGGDCDCFCTAVAAYAQACSEVGVCIAWRTPSICPLFCDYYNQQGECEWHYKPCGASCMKTCRNPSGKCLHNLPGLEGCYPNCPPDKPYFHEDQMKCVSLCDCYDNEDGKIYRRDECNLCECTAEGLQCKFDDKACYCIYDGNSYKYGQLIYNTTDGFGWCFSATCDVNGTIIRNIFKCGISTTPTSSTLSTIQPQTTASDMTTTTPMTTVCVKNVCAWSEWYDCTQPEKKDESGDYETFENLRDKGYSVCTNPNSVQFRAKEHPDTEINNFNQKVDCSQSRGLICNNKEQPYKQCHNYEIRILCCSYIPCSEIQMTTRRPTVEFTTTAVKSTPFTLHTKTKSTPQTQETQAQKSPKPTMTTKKESVTPLTETSVTAKTRQVPTLGYETTSTTVETSTIATQPPTSPTTASTLTQTPVKTTTAATTLVHSSTAPPAQRTTIINTTSGTSTTKTSTPLTERTTTITPTPTRLTTASSTVSTSRTTMASTTTSKATSAPEETSTIATQPPTSPTTASTLTQTPKTTTTATTLVHSSTAPTAQGTTISTPIVRASTTQISPSPTGGTTTITPTPTVPTSAATTTTAITSMTTMSCQQHCYWTQWFDVHSPSPGSQNGDMETFANIRAAGHALCDKPEDIKCRAKDYPERSLDQLGQIFECSLDIGLVCRNKDQIKKYPMCFNYEVQVKCCDDYHCLLSSETTLSTEGSSSTASPAETSTIATQPPASPTTASTLTQTPKTTTAATTLVHSSTAPPAQRTTIINTTSGTSTTKISPSPTGGTTTITPTPAGRTPTSSTVSTSRTTMASTTTSKATSAPEETSTIATQPPTSPTTASTLTQTPKTTTTATTLVHSSTAPTAQGTTISTPIVRASTTQISPSPTGGTTTITPTPTVPTSAATTTTAITSMTTMSCQQHCYWTQWFDVHSPSPGSQNGDMETFANIRAAGHALCDKPEDIKCRAKDYPERSLDQLGQIFECSLDIGLVCRNKDQIKKYPMCFNYEVQVKCCDDYHCLLSSETTLSTEGSSSTASPAETSTIATQPPASPTTASTLTQTPKTTTAATTLVHSSTAPPAQRTTIINTTSGTSTTKTSTPLTERTTTITPTPAGRTPTSSTVSTSRTTMASTTTSKATSAPEETSTVATQPPTSPTTASTLTQTPKTTTAATTLVHSSTAPPAQRTTISTPIVRASTTQISPSPTGGTTTITPTPAGRTPTSSTVSTSRTTMASTTTSKATSAPEETSTIATQPPTSPTTASTLTQTPKTTTTATTLVHSSTAPTAQGTTISTPIVRASTTQISPSPTGGTTTITPTPTVPTSAATTTTAITSMTTMSCQQHCYWTQWFDVHSPSPGSQNGDMETFANIRAAGHALCDKPEDIKCRAKDYPERSLDQLGQIFECSLDIGLVCRNKDQIKKYPMCFNYEVQVKCCDDYHCLLSSETTLSTEGSSSTASPAETSTIATQPPASPTTASTLTQTPKTTTAATTLVHSSTAPPAQRTTIINTTSGTSTTKISPSPTGGTTTITPTPAGRTPTSSTVSTSRTTMASTTTSKATSAPEETSTIATQPPISPTTASTLTQTPKTTTTATTLVHSSTAPTAQGTTISTPIVRASTTQISPSPTGGTTTITPTPTVPTSAATTTTAITSMTTMSCQQHCYWTQWFDVHSPSPGSQNGDMETFANIRAAGHALCDKPEDIKCRAKDYPERSLDQLGQIFECSLDIGLVCRNKDQIKKYPMCFNYEVQVKCSSPAETSTIATQPPASPTTASTLTQTPKTTTAATTLVHSSTAPPAQRTTIINTTSGTSTTKISPSPTGGTTTITPTPAGRTPTSSTVSTSRTTMASTTTSKATSAPEETSTVATQPPTSPTTASTLTQTPKTTTAATTLVHSSTAPPAQRTTIINTTSGTSTTKISPSPTGGTTTITPTPAGRTPTSSTVSTSRTTMASTTTSKATSAPEETSTIATQPPTSPTTASTLTQTPKTTTTATTLVHSSTAPTAQGTTISTPIVRASTTQISPSPTGGTTTITPTPTVPTSAATTTTAITSMTTMSCQQHCYWTQWFDVHSPSPGSQNGDMETFANIRAAGHALCDKPEDIKCRAKDYPERSLDQLGQIFECSLDIGLVCRNKDQIKKYPMCFNYEVQVKCCDDYHCLLSSETTLSTEGSSSTASPAETSTIATQPPASPTTASTLTQTPKTTTAATTLVHSSTAPPAQRTTIINTTSGTSTTKISPSPTGGTTTITPTPAGRTPTSSTVSTSRTTMASTTTSKATTAPEETSTIATQPPTSPTTASTLPHSGIPTNIGGTILPTSVSSTGRSTATTVFLTNFTTTSSPVFSTGEVVYKRTDKAGCIFYALCSKECEIHPFQGPCPSTTPFTSVTSETTTQAASSTERVLSSVSPTTATSLTTSVEINCTDVSPPRKVEYLEPVGMSTVIKPCKNCTCTSEEDKAAGGNIVHCEPINCSTSCPPGYQYVTEDGECCGKCIQIACQVKLSNNTIHVLQVNETMSLDHCSHYKCEKIEDQFVAVQTKRICPEYNPGECDPEEADTTPDGCCKICKPASCKPYSKKSVIHHGDCESSEPVELAYCEGSCPGSSVYSLETNLMQHECSCCQEFSSHTRDVTLTCQNGTSINYKYIYVEQCQCMNACTSESSAAHGFQWKNQQIRR
ncbi:mucin-5AC [Phalacrocorax carbo]|uniref:mucin-5AC n=1 Tax=Phalacrocorax carbo TaxID=9209 RepID=UPI00311A834E